MRGRHAVAFLAPVLLLMTGVFVVPLLQAAWTSVDGAALTPRAYAELAGSTLFWRVLDEHF